MDEKVKVILEKVKETAYAAGKAAGEVADVAAKKANKAMEVTKLSVANFDLSTDIEILYKEIGKLVHLTHLGEEIDPDIINDKLSIIDDKIAKIDENKQHIKDLRSANTCPNCGKNCKKEDSFCSACGYKF